MFFSKSSIGFTLAEVLIALLIIAEIATFTIPKILYSAQGAQFNAVTKETVGMVSAAYQRYQLSTSTVPFTAGIKDATPYMNYVAVASSSDTLDSQYSDPQNWRICGWASGVCLKLHSGAVLQYWPADSFGNANGTVPMMIDPDGQISDSTTNGPNKSYYFYLYYNGALRDYGSVNGVTTYTPPWFHW